MSLVRLNEELPPRKRLSSKPKAKLPSQNGTPTKAMSSVDATGIINALPSKQIVTSPETKAPAANVTSGKSQLLDTLTRFIPTEMLAPYVAFLAYVADPKHSTTVSTLSATSTSSPPFPPEQVYWWFVFATPLVSIFFQYAKCALDNQPWPIVKGVIWRALAATMAFGVWALTPPGGPFQDGTVLAGLAAVLVSPLLTGLDAIVLRLMNDSQAAQQS